MAGMDLLGRVEQGPNLPSVFGARLTNAAAPAYLRGVSGGLPDAPEAETGCKLLQHVRRAAPAGGMSARGGQAIVAGANGGSRSRGSKAKNGP